MSMSRGFMKEVLVLNLCSSILKTSKRKDTIKDESVVSRTSNKHHKINKKINAKIDNLVDIIDADFRIFMNQELHNYLKSNMESKVIKVLTISERVAETCGVSLEMLAIYILFHNFCERDNKLDSRLEKFNMASYYLDTIDMMNNTEIEHLEENMFNVSRDIIKTIKG